MRYNDKTLKRVSVNGFVLEVSKIWARNEPEADAYFQVIEGDSYDEYGETDETEFETEELAMKYMDERIEALRDKPNWNAQAAYDEEHGTVNGEDPGVVAMRELGW